MNHGEQQPALAIHTLVECDGYTLTLPLTDGFNGISRTRPGALRGVDLSFSKEQGTASATLHLRAVFAPRPIRTRGDQQPLYHGSNLSPERHDIELDGTHSETYIERSFLQHMRQLLTFGSCVFATIDEHDPSKADVEIRGIPIDAFLIGLLEQIGKLGNGHTFTEFPATAGT